MRVAEAAAVVDAADAVEATPVVLEVDVEDAEAVARGW